MNSSNIATGLNVATMIPLDYKRYAKDEAEILNLGTNSQKAFLLHKGISIFNRENSKDYYWLEVTNVDTSDYEKVGNSYTYPDSIVVDGIVYSNKMYSFYIKKATSIDPTPPVDYKEVTNKDLAGVKILDNDYKLKVLKAGDNITLVESPGSITIKGTPGSSGITKFFPVITIDSSVPKKPELLQYQDLYEVTEAISSGSLQTVENPQVQIVSDLKVVNFEKWMKDVIINDSVKIEVSANAPVKTKLNMSGGGSLHISNLKVDNELNLSNITVTSDTPIIASETSKVNIQNSSLLGSQILKSSGAVSVSNTNFKKSETTVMGRSATPSSVIMVGDNATVDLKMNTFEVSNIVDVEESSNVIIEIKGSDTKGVQGSLITGAKSANITSFGNDLGEAVVSDTQNVISKNDTSSKGLELKLQTFKNHDEAYGRLGSGFLYLEYDSDKKTSFVNYTHEKK